MDNTRGFCFSRSINTERVISVFISAYVAFAPAYCFAIDIPVGAFSAFGGTAEATETALGLANVARGAGVAAAATAAELSAAAAVGAAAVGVGFASYCAASYLYGVNACASGSAAAAISSAGYRFDDPTQSIVKDVDAGYFYATYDPYYQSMFFKYATADQACRDVIAHINKKYAEDGSTKYLDYLSASIINDDVWSPVQCKNNIRDKNDNNVLIPDNGQWVNRHPAENHTEPADSDKLGVAVGANPNSRAGTAAAAAAAAAGADQNAQDNAYKVAAANPSYTPEADCNNKGMLSGTVNGTVICVPVVGDTDLQGQTGTGGETNTGEGTGTNTATGEGTGTNTDANTDTNTKTPAFCVYAVTLCNWLNWTQAEPVNQKSTYVDIKDFTTTGRYELDNLPDENRVRFNFYCPNPQPINLTVFNTNISVDFSYDPICQLAIKLKPIIVAISYLSGAYIIAGVNRGGVSE